jgi:hypothetical protein
VLKIKILILKLPEFRGFISSTGGTSRRIIINIVMVSFTLLRELIVYDGILIERGLVLVCIDGTECSRVF